MNRAADARRVGINSIAASFANAHRSGFTSSLPLATRRELSRLVPEAGFEPREPGGDHGQGRLFAAIRDLESAGQKIPFVPPVALERSDG